jgi:hypothetical protein
MTELLIAVGVFVFFISVYGVVMVGGHLLEELELADQKPDLRPRSDEDEHALGVAATPT